MSPTITLNDANVASDDEGVFIASTHDVLNGQAARDVDGTHGGVPASKGTIRIIAVFMDPIKNL